MDKRPQIELPKKTFWFEKWDGSIFATQEEEAWRIVNKRNQVYEVKPPHKLIGVSTGEIFYQAVIEAQKYMQAGDMDKAKEIVNQGHQDELESGRGKIEAPRNFDTIDKNGQPAKI